MKIIFSTIFLILISILEIKAQSSTPIIEVSKGFPKYAFKYGELNVGVLEVASIFKKMNWLIKQSKRADQIIIGLCFLVLLE
jgi:hypothetical protein